METNIELMLKKQLENFVKNEVAKMIKEETDRFYRELTYKKDKYIAELMKSIRIFSEEQTLDNIPRYLITIENTYKIEK